MTTTPTPETLDQQLKELQGSVAELQAQVKKLDSPSRAYPTAPEGTRWVPYFSKSTQGAFVAIGVIAGLVGAILFTVALDPDKGTNLDPVRLTNVYLTDIALVLLGLGVALVLGEVARLEKTSEISELDISAKENLEAAIALFKSLTAGRLIFAIGFILLLSNAYLAKS